MNRKIGKICIQLKSDLVPGSGQSWANLIDSDIVYDQYGFPYIPAKRIKGLLKESALELEEFGILEKNTSHLIFGNNEIKGHHFVLYNALLDHITELQNEYRTLDNQYLKYLNKYIVLDYYTNIRYQTAIDEYGIAQKNTLRSVRAIDKGNAFYSIVEYEEDDEDILEKCLKNVKHMGLMRTRGFGEVELSLDSYESKKDNKKKENGIAELEDNQDYDIKLYLENQSALVISSIKGQKTLDYISGSSVLGYFAHFYLLNHEVDNRFYDLFVKGKVRFSNGYISDENWNEYYPVRESVYKEKVGNRYFDQSLEKLNPNRSKVRNKYMSKEGYLKEVKKEIIYHHRRPDDKSIGHVISNEGKEQGIFYQNEAISAYQRFIVHLYGKGKDLKEVLENVGKYIQIGASKYVQYGNVIIDHIKYTQESKRIIPAGTEVMCTLISPVVLLNNRNESLVTTKAIESQLPLENVTSYLDQTTLGGYNTKWQLQKPSYTAYKAGSCLKGTLTNDLENMFVLGSLTQEGNGIIMVQTISEIEKQQINRRPTFNFKNTTLPKYLKNIIITSIKENMKLDILKAFKEKEIDKELTAASIGRVLNMIKNQSWNDFKKDVSGIADDNKKVLVEHLIYEIENDCLKIYEKYPLLDDSIKEVFYLEACREYFIQAKFERRNVL